MKNLAILLLFLPAFAGPLDAEPMLHEPQQEPVPDSATASAAATIAEAAAIRRLDHGGTVLPDGAFRRSNWHGGMEGSALEHDRARALHLLTPLVPLADNLAPETRAALFAELADSLLLGRDDDRSWRLFSLTDLSVIPEPGPDFPVKTGLAPTAANGAPVFHSEPPSWEEARTDGERWRWALARLAESDSVAASRRLARFAWGQFGTGTLPPPSPKETASAADSSDPYGLASLAPDEALARLASGVRRFRLPPDWNPGLLLAAADDAEALGRWHESRQNYDQALTVYRTDPERFADRIAMIESPAVIVRRTPVPATPEHPVEFDFAVRNARRIDFEIRSVGLDGLLDDGFCGGYGFGIHDPEELHEESHLEVGTDWRGLLGSWTNAVGDIVASWSEAFDPAPGHRLRVGHTATPAPLPGGLYLVRISVPGGNETRAIFEVVDTAILISPPNRPSTGDAIELPGPIPPQTTGLLLADACDGRPIDGAEGQIVFEHSREEPPAEPVSMRTDADGTASFSLPQGQYNILARGLFSGPGSRHAVYMANSRGHPRYVRPDNRHRAWDGERPCPAAAIVTDRPVCPPGGTVRFKLWLSSQTPVGPLPVWSNVPVSMNLFDDDYFHRRIVMSVDGVTDATGSFSGSLQVPADLAPGVYRLDLRSKEFGTLRLNTSLRVATFHDPGSDNSPPPAPFEPEDPPPKRDASQSSPRPRDDLPLRLSLDRASYAIGDTARIALHADRPDSWVLVTTRVGTDRAHTEWVHLRGRETSFELPLNEADVPNVFVEALAFHDGRFLSDSVSIEIPPAAHLATVSIEAPSSAEPGTRVEVRVRVAAPDEHPAANASVTLSVCAAPLFEFTATPLFAFTPDDGKTAPDEAIWGWRNQLLGVFGTNPEVGGGFFGPEGGRGPEALAGDRFACPWWGVAAWVGRQTMPPPGGDAQPMFRAMSSPVMLARLPEPASVPVAPALAEPLVWLPELEPADKPGFYRAAFDLPGIPADWVIRAWATLPGSVLGHAESVLVTTSDLLADSVSPP